MTGKRNSAKQIANKQCKTRLKWTEAMNTKLLKCKREAKEDKKNRAKLLKNCMSLSVTDLVVYMEKENQSCVSQR